MERKKENRNENAKTYLPPLLRGLVAGIVSFFLLLLLTAFVVGKIKPVPSVLSVVLVPVLVLSGFIGGGISALSYGKKGLFLGGITGGILGALELIASVIVLGTLPPPEVFVKAVILLVSGMIGGYFGVNKKKRRRRK